MLRILWKIISTKEPELEKVKKNEERYDNAIFHHQIYYQYEPSRHQNRLSVWFSNKTSYELSSRFHLIILDSYQQEIGAKIAILSIVFKCSNDCISD